MSREWHLKRDRAFRKRLAAGMRAPRRNGQKRAESTAAKRTLNRYQAEDFLAAAIWHEISTMVCSTSANRLDVAR